MRRGWRRIRARSPERSEGESQGLRQGGQVPFARHLTVAWTKEWPRQWSMAPCARVENRKEINRPRLFAEILVTVSLAAAVVVFVRPAIESRIGGIVGGAVKIAIFALLAG